MSVSLKLIAVMAIVFMLFGAASAEVTGDVTAFTAASLTGASEDLAAKFVESNPDANVVWNLAGTQTLKTQVEEGALPDVFISASAKYTNEMTEAGFFVNDSVKDLCTNWIIVITPANNPANISTLADLANDGVKIATGTDDVPVGMNTIKVLNNIGNSSDFGEEWLNAVNANIVTKETAEPDVLSKVKLGEVDAGFVYGSSYAASKDELTAVEISEEFNVIQKYSIATMATAPNMDAAVAFEDYMLGDGQTILADYGFTSVA